MILVLGGTADGRELAYALDQAGYKVLLSVVSEYGTSMVGQNSGVQILEGALDEEKMKRLLTERRVRLIVDATHPYAAVITATALKVAGETETPYIRFERGITDDTSDTRIHRVKSYDEAAELSMKLGETVFLTVGSKNIKPFIDKARESGKRLVARVLPASGVIDQCIAAGLSPKNIIAVQGPFSKQLNVAMLKEYSADVVVTKDSGSTGGTDTKLEAAFELDLPVVLIERPDSTNVPTVEDFKQLVDWVKASYTNVNS